MSARRGAVAVVCALVLSLSGCATPHLEAQVREASKPGVCESAYLSASNGTQSMAAGRPAMMRYLAASSAAESWITVASSCPSRFAEGTMRSAQASATAQALASALGVAASGPATVDYGEVAHLNADENAIAAISLAEDRAGFSLEVLAARSAPNATLAASDNHKTAAQRLFDLSGVSKDPRHKVYAVDQLIAHPDTIADPATGLTTNTVAAIEMNCARAYLDALSTDGDAGNDENADGTSTDATTDATANDAANTASGTAASKKTLDWLARMASARAWHAFELGYPTFDAALFD